MNNIGRYQWEKQELWREIVDQVPAIKFPGNWLVKIIPPFAGAVARFLVSDSEGRGRISVYLDWHDHLGFMQQPYWEVYPVDGDTARFLLNETDDLVACISSALAVDVETPHKS